MKKKRDYQEEYRKRKEKTQGFRIYEDDRYVKVSKSNKVTLGVTIHPYIRDEYRKISDSMSKDIQKWLIQQIEDVKGKKIILK